MNATPHKTVYNAGDKLDPSGLSLTATFSDGSTQTITSGFTCDPGVLNNTGRQTVTVTYDGQTASFSVTVQKVELTGISINTLPGKTTYMGGEMLDTTGLTLTATYSNGTTQIITSGFTCDKTLLDANTTVTVMYNGYTATFDVVVNTVENQTAGMFGNNIYWELRDGVLTLTGKGEMPLPDVVNDIAQTPWVSHMDTIHTVNIGEGITNVAGYLFSGYTKLEQVYLPDSITDIVNFAFYNCTSLKQINIPNNVTAIRAVAFGGCSGLTQLTIPESVTFLGIQAFYGCSGLTEISIPSGVTTLETGLFQGCTSLKQITVPAGVTTIGDNAFLGCSSLAQITVLNKDCVIVDSNNFGTTLGDLKMTTVRGYKDSTAEKYAKTYGYLFELLDASEDVEEEDAPLASGKYGDNITWTLTKDGVLTLTGKGDMPDAPNSYSVPWSQYNEDIQTVQIEQGITSIGAHAFSDCTYLTQITIPSSVTSIGNRAFDECLRLTQINIPDSVTSIGESAFAGAGLTQLVIPGSVAYIGKYAFEFCDNLNLITISDGVTSISDYAFSDCADLTKVEIPNSVKSIGIGAFENCTSLTQIVIPDSVTSIGDWAFSNCTGLLQVDIPSSVKSIGRSAFEGCTSLAQVTLPSSITRVDMYLFYGCTNLTQVVIPSSVASIERYAFEGCTSLTQINILNKNCVIYDDEFTLGDADKICGYAGSTAETYAQKYGYKFEALA